MPDDLVAASDVQGSSFASHPQGSLPKGTAEDSLGNDEHGEGDAGEFRSYSRLQPCEIPAKRVTEFKRNSHRGNNLN